MTIKHLYAITKKFIQRLIIKSRMSRYYLKDDKNPKTVLGAILDFLFLRLFILTAFYLWLVQRTKAPIFSLTLASFLTLLASITLHLWKRKSLAKKRWGKRRSVSRSYLQNRLSQLSSDDFKWQLMQLLLNTEGFSNIQDRGDYLEADFYDGKVAVGFHHAPYSEHTTPHDVYTFVYRVHTDGYTHALFISLAPFTESCHEISKKKFGVNTHLIDSKELLDMMEHAQMLPDDEIVDGIIAQEFQRKSKQRKKIQQEILTPRKIKRYLTFAFIFFTASFFIRSFQIYYLVLSASFLLFSLLTFLLSPKNAQDQDPFDSMFSSEKDY